MPRISSKKSAPNKSSSTNDDAFHLDEDNLPDSQHSSTLKEDDAPVKCSKKRSYQAEEDEPQDFSNEMQKMLECFGADISKTLIAKRKRLEQYTQSSLKTSNRRVEDIWKNQQSERQKLNDEFKRQVSAVFQQWETDLEKTKDQEEKLNNVFRQQQKLFQQTRVVQSQRLKTIKQLHEQYTQGIESLEKCHSDQQASVQGELKKEMALLQKRILMDTQQQEMANVRKSLQTMLF